jgi:signal transduction histidine kinase
MRFAKTAPILTWIFATAALLCLTAWGWLTARHATILESPAEVIQDFVGSAILKRRIGLGGIHSELLMAESVLPRTHLYRYVDIEALKKLADQCQSFPNPPSSLSKAVHYHQGVCDGVSVPGETFFNSGPLMHPAGVSFAYLVWQNNSSGLDSSWLKNREAQFHLRELSKLPLATELSEPFQTLRLLNESAIKALEYGLATILDHQMVLIQDLAKSEEIVFMVFDRSEWDWYFLLRGTRPENFSSIARCGLTRYDLCIEQAPLLRYLGWLSILFLVSAFLLMLTRWFELRQRLRLKKMEELENRRTMVSILSHELRTPVASIGLNVEVLRRSFDQLSEETQDAVLRIFSDANRLQRIIRGSEDFLRASTVQIESKTQWSLVSISQILEQMRDVIQFKINAVDGNSLDVLGTREWVEICIRNVLENASRHGRGEITVSAGGADDSVFVEISDEGVWLGGDTGVRQPFQRSDASQGMGLGLYVTHELMHLMGGNMVIQTNPTRVRLEWLKK